MDGSPDFWSLTNYPHPPLNDPWKIFEGPFIKQILGFWTTPTSLKDHVFEAFHRLPRLEG